MKAVLALVFFACIAGSMANPLTDAVNPMIQQLIQTGQAAAQSVIGALQQQILAIAQQVSGQLSNLLGSFGPGRNDIIGGLMSTLQGLGQQLLQQLLGSVAGLISSIGGRADVLATVGQHFSDFLASIQGAITGLGTHFLNQGLSAVLGGLGGRGIGDIFAGLSAQISGVVSQAQSALAGILGNLQEVAVGVLDSAKPHWQQLQENLVGHGLNALGSLSETINNMHGSITGGR